MGEVLAVLPFRTTLFYIFRSPVLRCVEAWKTA